MAQDVLTKAFITIKPVGFNESDRVKFESLLTIAGNMLDIPWKITDTLDADFYLVVNSLKPQMAQDNLLKSLPQRKCIFYTEEKTNCNYHEILVDRNNTPYLRSLVDLLKTLSGSINYENSSSSVNTPVTSQDARHSNVLEDVCFDPKQGFIGLLLAGDQELLEYHLNQAEVIDNIYVDAINKVYYCKSRLENLEHFFTEDTVPMKLNISEQQLLQIINDNKLKPMPLTNLLWYGTFISSKGRLIKGCSKNDIVHLKRWPDINLPGLRKLIKLAAFMQSNAVDFDTIQQRTNIPADQVYNFFNACKVIDLIEHGRQVDIHEKVLDDSQRQLFAKIGKRLNRGESSNEQPA